MREETAQGAGPEEPPRWPVVKLERAGCLSLGCEREGSRSESYTVSFRDNKGQQYRVQCR